MLSTGKEKKNVCFIVILEIARERNFPGDIAGL